MAEEAKPPKNQSAERTPNGPHNPRGVYFHRATGTRLVALSVPAADAFKLQGFEYEGPASEKQVSTSSTTSSKEKKLQQQVTEAQAAQKAAEDKAAAAAAAQAKAEQDAADARAEAEAAKKGTQSNPNGGTN